MRMFFLSLALCVAGLASAQTVPQTKTQISLSFAPLVRQAAPAVVNIYAKQIRQERISPFADDPFFGDFFGNLRREPRVANSLGSGVILSADGLVVTNYHVVANATDIRAVLADRREYQAVIVLADESADLAILRLQDASGLQYLPLQNADRAQVGDLVLAIGNPFGIGQTVTSGIVSGLARSARPGRGQSYYIQTDAAINPGNSGGALIDLSGHLLGVPTAILTRSGGSNGVGFAVPADLVAAFVQQARSGATEVAWPWLGLRGQPMDGALAEAMGIAAPDGLVIAQVHPESPFANAGLQPRDVILSIDTYPVQSMSEVEYRLMTAAQQSVNVTYLRSGVQAQVQVQIISPQAEDLGTVQILRGALAGLGIAAISPPLLDRLDLPLNASGVVITEVRDPASRFNFRPGDVLIKINGIDIQTVKDVQDVAERGGRTWFIDFLRGGRLNRLRYRI